jgi:hypothetical protein
MDLHLPSGPEWLAAFVAAGALEAVLHILKRTVRSAAASIRRWRWPM